MPLLVPAYIVLGLCGSIARDAGWKEKPNFPPAGSPEFASLQLAPEFVVLNIPASVAAYTLLVSCGSTAKAVTVRPRSPTLDGLQVAAPSVVLRIPEPLVD